MAVNSRGRRRAWNEHFTCKENQIKKPDGGEGRGYEQENVEMHTHTPIRERYCTVVSEDNDWWLVIAQSDPQTRGTEGFFHCYHLTCIINKVRQIKPKWQVWTGDVVTEQTWRDSSNRIRPFGGGVVKTVLVNGLKFEWQFQGWHRWPCY